MGNRAMRERERVNMLIYWNNDGGEKGRERKGRKVK
jgi:hypothetical protein